MQISVHDRTHQASQGIGAYAARKVTSLERYGHLVARAKVGLFEVGHRHRSSQCARIVIQFSAPRMGTLMAAAIAADPKAAVDLCLDRIDRRLRSHKELLQAKPRRLKE